jgi:amino acid adenylation domain-containing protein
MAEPPRLLQSGFLRSSEQHPERPALEVGGERLTYAELHERAARIAATLAARAPDEGDDAPLTAVFAYRSPPAFAGLLGALLRGHGYVPLNRTHPVARTRSMFERCRCRALVVDEASAAELPELLAGSEPGRVALLPEVRDVSGLAAALPDHTVLGAEDLLDASDHQPPAGDPEAIAYILFTSGSTGVPKGVMVAHRNVFNYLDFVADRFAITPEDRLSQTHDMTFDVSVMDMFLAWERGACVCCPPAEILMRPGGFIRDAKLTFWAAVPSTAVFMRRFGMLKPDTYPLLRHIVCAGEPLPLELAEAYTAAAPNAAVDNLYGPTELTIECTYYRFDPARKHEAEHGVVPMGEPFPNMVPLVADAELREVPPGETGELLMAGPQVTLGYWRDPERTAESFVVPPEREERYYRTGDLVRRPRSDGDPITYLGRIDNQIKIRGVRVELGEIEAALRAVTGVDAAVAVGWPRTTSGANGVVAFVGDEKVDAEAAIEALRERLASQMVPRRIIPMDEIPVNANGKFDRAALVASLDQEDG